MERTNTDSLAGEYCMLKVLESIFSGEKENYDLAESYCLLKLLEQIWQSR
jgi:hypothetical protein